MGFMVKDDRDNDLSELTYWCVILRTRSLGFQTFQRLIQSYKNPRNICRLSAAELLDQGLSEKIVWDICNPDWKRIEKDLEWLQCQRNHLITINDKAYPELLRQIHSPPIAMFVKGDPSLLKSLQLSLVGSRRPSPDGRNIASEMGSNLAKLGITITSGLAVGIDSFAHTGALDVGGNTIAVLGNGLETIYPARNKKIAESIIDNGALISEFPLDQAPLPANFPRRNRIISGLSIGTLVIEAAIRSGSLITARYALEQGREVFAVPGSIYNPVSRGCHELIRQGAKLVDKLEDILEEFGPLISMTQGHGQNAADNETKIKILDAEQKLLLDNIGRNPITIDSLVEITRLKTSSVSTALVSLELDGEVESLPGGEYVRC
jgi:DNA processing protein